MKGRRRFLGLRSGKLPRLKSKAIFIHGVSVGMTADGQLIGSETSTVLGYLVFCKSISCTQILRCMVLLCSTKKEKAFRRIWTFRRPQKIVCARCQIPRKGGHC